MRKINTRDFRVATRTTSRDINRRIALNVIREHQPISRADLARHLNITRGVVSTLVQELIAQGVIYEGAHSGRGMLEVHPEKQVGVAQQRRHQEHVNVLAVQPPLSRKYQRANHR